LLVGNGAARLLVTLPPEYPEIAPIVRNSGLDMHVWLSIY
jgi:hypothetical protein